MTRRTRCPDPLCPCVEHLAAPGVVRMMMEAVPPLPDPMEGFIVGLLAEDGSTEVTFKALRGQRLVTQALPDLLPVSWRAAHARVERFLRVAVMSA